MHVQRGFFRAERYKYSESFDGRIQPHSNSNTWLEFHWGLNTESSFDYTEYKSKRRLGNFTEKRLLVSNKFENRLP